MPSVPEPCDSHRTASAHGSVAIPVNAGGSSEQFLHGNAKLQSRESLTGTDLLADSVDDVVRAVVIGTEGVRVGEYRGITVGGGPVEHHLLAGGDGPVPDRDFARGHPAIEREGTVDPKQFVDPGFEIRRSRFTGMPCLLEGLVGRIRCMITPRQAANEPRSPAVQFRRMLTISALVSGRQPVRSRDGS